jgi:hypothetical protein
MTNRGATGRYLQKAFLQAKGELCLEVSSQPKTAAEMPMRSESQSTGEDPQPRSRAPIREARCASGVLKTIQSP